MKKFSKALLIYNGNAGQKDLKKTLSICVSVLAPHLPDLRILQTEGPGDAKEYCRQYGETVDVLFILGGDGTVHECINGLASLQKRPVIGLLPGGTCNDFSRTLHIPQVLANAAEAVIHGEIKEIDAAQTGEDYFLNFWGIGLIAETAENIKDHEKAMLGRVSYFLSAIRTMREMDPFSYHIKTENETIEGQAVMVLILNGRFIGTQEWLPASIQADDGLLDIFIIKNTNLAMLREFFSLNTQETIDNDLLSEVQHHQAQSISLVTDEKMNADMDGEVYASSPAEIAVLPNHFRFLVPAETP
ncbi:YegS/Rv2252/BmrU family lipid kinase [Bacillus lacus]|uniref:YegS/Rv2252/BmrU family lipid kinase n=1 Tax=Metabacillus lacus TaxID=1983721 RepID=A0A7X2J0E3_9BACI|nr:YegS/Rv2252/BmrU family lipid kinase [Metabacillus lacus]MRX73143.1 YegS/Rv2252/BmrU family lipid kinase [Metabacillus lacus]